MLEHFEKLQRIADLNQCEYHIDAQYNSIAVWTTVNTQFGEIEKRYLLMGEHIPCDLVFAENHRSECSRRLGYITLLDTETRMWFACHNGGYDLERFEVTDDINHCMPLTSKVLENGLSIHNRATKSHYSILV